MTDWTAIEALPRTTLTELFESEPDRLSRLAHDVCGMRFDFAKTHLSAEALAAFGKMVKASDLAGKRAALFGGEVVNVTEGRAVEHTAERGEGAPESVARAQALHSRMRALIDAIEKDA
ncbi:MAG: glucose-6-phosphate isomerase, partial [Pseudomonadota bacterium]